MYYKFYLWIVFLSFTSSSYSIKICVTTIPKCGSHLLETTLFLLIDIKPKWANLNIEQLNQYKIIIGHFTYDIYNNQQNHFEKGIFLLRDPRDQLVSHVYHALLHNSNMYRGLSFDSLLQYFIEKGNTPHFPSYKNILELYNKFMPWQNNPKFITVKFENLVGKKGGGSSATQLKELKKIAKHLGIKIDDNNLKYLRKSINNFVKSMYLSNSEFFDLSETIFGNVLPGSAQQSFRSGQIGAWKNHFKPYHKESFKKIAGQLLIDLGYEPSFEW